MANTLSMVGCVLAVLAFLSSQAGIQANDPTKIHSIFEAVENGFNAFWRIKKLQDEWQVEREVYQGTVVHDAIEAKSLDAPNDCGPHDPLFIMKSFE